MPTLTKITFEKPINTSLQVGDMVYVSSETDGIITSPSPTAVALEVGSHHVLIDKDNTIPPIITASSFISFAKNIIVNESSLKGYYADVTFQNSSNTKTELFAISSEVALSSK